MKSRLLTAVLILGGLFVAVDRSCAGSYSPPPSNQSPVAILTVDPENTILGNIVTLDGNASYDPDGSITKYEWDFDYNGTTFTPDYTSGDGITTYVYNQAGTYTVKLRVVDNDGSSATTVSGVIYVGDNIEYSFGGQYGLTGTIGQPDVRYSSGDSYELFGGFWFSWPFLLNE